MRGVKEEAEGPDKKGGGEKETNEVRGGKGTSRGGEVESNRWREEGNDTLEGEQGV